MPKKKKKSQTQSTHRLPLTKSQVEAAKRRAKLKKQVKRAVVKTPRSMGEILERLGLPVNSNNATKVRSVLHELIDEGVVHREGTTRDTTYEKA